MNGCEIDGSREKSKVLNPLRRIVLENVDISTISSSFNFGEITRHVIRNYYTYLHIGRGNCRCGRWKTKKPLFAFDYFITIRSASQGHNNGSSSRYEEMQTMSMEKYRSVSLSSSFIEF